MWVHHNNTANSFKFARLPHYHKPYACKPVGDTHRLLSFNKNIAWVTVYTLHFHNNFAQPSKKVSCHCQPIVLQNNHVCWHLPGVFLSLRSMSSGSFVWLVEGISNCVQSQLNYGGWSRLLCWGKWEQHPQTNVQSTIWACSCDSQTTSVVQDTPTRHSQIWRACSQHVWWILRVNPLTFQ